MSPRVKRLIVDGSLFGPGRSLAPGLSSCPEAGASACATPRRVPVSRLCDTMKAMADDLFEVQCPCCGGRLEISAETETVVHHEAPKPESIPEDLREAVRRVKAAESGREERFRKRLDAQRQQDKTLDKRFEGLLKKAKDGGPPERFTRDIDLD